MKRLYVTLTLIVLLAGCKDKPAEQQPEEKKIVFNPALAEELEKMKEVDQIAGLYSTR